jgi:general stress protein YciG
MSPDKQREIASKGGRVAHEKGAAHEWTVDEARLAGRKGGYARHDRRDGLTLVARLDALEATGQWPNG